MSREPVVQVRYQGPVPAKANHYRFGQGRFFVSKQVRDFEAELERLFTTALPHTVTWAVPPKRKRPRPVNPLYPTGHEVTVSITYRCARRHQSDTDGVLKAILDAATRAGVWADDAQVQSIQITRERGDRSAHQLDSLEIAISPVLDITQHAQPSPLGRREWLAQRVAEESLGIPEPVPTTYCDQCGVAIGPYCAAEEVWTEPYFRTRGQLAFRVICGQCADAIDLAWRYRAITPAEMRRLRRFEPAQIIKVRVKELTREHLATRERARKPSRGERAQRRRAGESNDTTQ